MIKVNLAGLVGQAVTANSFTTVAHTDSGNIGYADNTTTNPTPTTWATETGSDENWIENGGATPLSYSITAFDNATQSITIVIEGGPSGPLTIYGQVLGWNSGGLLLNGFTDPGLSVPLPGATHSFVLGANLSADGVNPAGADYTASPLQPTPFGLPGFSDLALDIGSMVGMTIGAKSFATVTASVGSQNGPQQGADVNASSKIAGLHTWQTQTGTEPWIENGGANPLTYTITAASTDEQVLTIQVQGAGGATPFNIYAEVIGWNAGAMLLEGYLDPGLTQPINGLTPYFVMGTSILASGLNSAGNEYFSAGTTAPFGLGTVVDAPSCFAQGTSIATPSGLRRVEDLAVGDLVLTASGQSQPIQWVGSSTIACARHRQPGRVMPVRIAADAFGPGLPLRDLFLSPEHAVLDDGALIPVHCLVNGATIRQVPVERVAYYHIELAQHDVLLAEGLPAESYRETGNRSAMQILDRSVRAA